MQQHARSLLHMREARVDALLALDHLSACIQPSLNGTPDRHQEPLGQQPGVYGPNFG